MRRVNLVLAYSKYNIGEHLTDIELAGLIKNHTNLIENLDEINDRKFLLFRIQINRDLSNFIDYRESRKRNFKKQSDVKKSKK